LLPNLDAIKTLNFNANLFLFTDVLVFGQVCVKVKTGDSSDIVNIYLINNDLDRRFIFSWSESQEAFIRLRHAPEEDSFIGEWVEAKKAASACK
jgi:hypothetical protein